MALWNYYAPRFLREDPWDLFEPEPFESTLLSSPFGLPRRRALRSTSPGTRRVNEVVSDKDKYQVKVPSIVFTLTQFNLIDYHCFVCLLCAGDAAH